MSTPYEGDWVDSLQTQTPNIIDDGSGQSSRVPPIPEHNVGEEILIDGIYYIVTSYVDKGSFGHVYKVSDRDGNIFALKVQYNGWKAAQNELMILKAVKGNTHFIQLISSEVKDEILYIVMEFADGGTLLNFIEKNSSIEEKIRVIQAIIEALRHLEKLGIAHCDLKPENILLRADGSIAVSDFGLSQIIEEYNTNDRATELCSLWYRAPELCEYMGIRHIFSTTDVWSLGMIIFEMFHEYNDPMFTFDSELEITNLEAKTIADRAAELSDPKIVQCIISMMDSNPWERTIPQF
jgi:serine/threonine protein kinase